MPVETRFRPKFGELVKHIIGKDSLGQASARTSISKAYLIQLSGGKVPTPAIIEKFALGYADRGVDYHTLLVAAGYETIPQDYQLAKSSWGTDVCIPAGSEPTQEDIDNIAAILERGSETVSEGKRA